MFQPHLSLIGVPAGNYQHHRFASWEHFFVCLFRKTHFAYIPDGKVKDLSKINLIVCYCISGYHVQVRFTKPTTDANMKKNSYSS